MASRMMEKALMIAGSLACFAAVAPAISANIMFQAKAVPIVASYRDLVAWFQEGLQQLDGNISLVHGRLIVPENVTLAVEDRFYLDIRINHSVYSAESVVFSPGGSLNLLKQPEPGTNLVTMEKKGNEISVQFRLE